MTPQTRLDLLADEILDGLAPLEFGPARSAAEIDTVLQLRYQSVVEEGWGLPDDFPDRRERDEYDVGAIFVVCRDGPEIVGSARLVPPLPGRTPLIEREFDVTLDAPGRALEAGRLVVPRRHRPGRSHLILAGLFARGWLLARERGFDRVVGQATTRILELYRGLGLRVELLGPARHYFGEDRYPIEIAGADAAVVGAWAAAFPVDDGD